MQINIPKFVDEIITNFEKSGYEIYVVGGAVRDVLIGKTPTDWDFTTNARPEAITALFPNSYYDNKFGTVGITNPSAGTTDNYYGKTPVYEVTTFRTEANYTDSRHPEKIEWGQTVEEDLKRRDFTINAMALKRVIERQSSKVSKTEQNAILCNAATMQLCYSFELTDLFGSKKDLDNKLIHAVGNPDTRFQEDALRMLRAIRFAAQMGFTIEEKTFKSIRENVDLVNNISPERIRDELLKLLSYENAYQGMLMFRDSGLMKIIMPELEKTFGVEQKSPGRHHIYDVGTHLFESLKHSKSKNPVVNLAILLHDAGKPIVAGREKNGTITFYNHELVSSSIAKNIARRLRMTNKDMDKLYTLVRWHQFTVDEHQTDKAIRRFIRNVGIENLDDMLDLRRADRLGGAAKETSWRFEQFKQKLIEVQKQPFTVADLKVDGHDVMEIVGIPAGPKVGKILNSLFAEVEEDIVKNEREYLIGRLKELVKKGRLNLAS